jgi:hypothetical protein
MRTGEVPEDLATEEVKWLTLDEDAHNALEDAKGVISVDLRFEYLDRTELDKALWRFTCECFLDRSSDKVAGFIVQHARPVVNTTCYLPVEYLSVDEERTVSEVRLLPTNAVELPPAERWFRLDPPVGCVAAVAVSGTSYQLMAERARAVAEHALRVLRISLRAHPFIHHRQLRFRLGESYAFREQLTGYQSRDDTSWALTYGAKLVDTAVQEKIFGLPRVPRNHLERKADLAARWIERGMLATEPIVSLLYYFFALEALLGDKSQTLKAPILAFRRAMLATAVGSGFSHPTETHLLYEDVRSAAVHGSDVQNVSDEIARNFGWDVRRALVQYLEFAADRGFTRQSQLVMALDTHFQHGDLVAWLRDNGGPKWTDYLDGLSAEGPTPEAQADGRD